MLPLLALLLALQQQDPLAPLEPVPRVAQPPSRAVVSRPPPDTLPDSKAGSKVAPSWWLPSPAVPAPVPAVPVYIPSDWAGVFSAIRSGNWTGASAAIAALPDGPLKPLAKAELYTAKGSPLVSVEDLESLIAAAPELPQAGQLERMAAARGAIQSIAIPQRPIVGFSGAPRRGRAPAVAGDPVAAALRIELDPLLKVDSADAAEALYLEQASLMSPEGRAEAAQRIAWSYYGLGRDSDAVRVAEAGRAGASGDWAMASAWVAGLASWRQGDCSAAGARFREVAAGTRDTELAAAAAYWAARSAQACRQPEAVTPLLRIAAQSPESFYGLMARETLGMTTRIPAPSPAATSAVDGLPNVRRAEALVAIGETGLAEEALRHQARIGRPEDQRALIAVAQRLDLAGAQFWLAHNGQRGASVEAAARYPRPRWVPQNGWRVEPALAFGHIIQESNFRSGAISAAGAVGLMQVRPGTAGDSARARGLAFDPASLTDPKYNIDYGQAFIELLRGNPATRSQLPRVIAAYNAGPLPVARWSAINDRGDPLLWIESIPYWETRYYVPAVMRNMWVYEGLAGAEQRSLRALAEHRWPDFPTR